MRKRHTASCFSIFLSFLFVGLLTTLASASDFPEGKEDLFVQNDILFYEPGIETRNFNNSLYSYSSYFGCGTGTGNKNYRGDTVWSDSSLRQIERNRPIYEKAAAEQDLPWELLAVFHFQEHSLLRTNPSNGEGIYQLTSYTNQGTNENRFEPTSAEVSEEEFLRQTKIAAKLIKENYARGLDLRTADGIKNLFYNYNGHGGTRYKDKALALGFSEAQAAIGEGSPYVMNRYDEQRDPLSPNMNPAWRGIFVGNGVYDTSATDSRNGAFVNYMALVGLYETGAQYTSSTPSAGNSSGSNKIAQQAIAISKPGYKSGDVQPTSAYINAMRIADTLNITSVNTSGASCDVFVATVLRTTVDSHFPKASGGSEQAQRKYLQQHTELYQRIYPNNNINALQPGDILVTGDENHRHIQIFVSVNGQPGLAAASHNNRTGQHWATTNNIFNITMGSTYYTYDVYRFIGDGIGQGVNTSLSQPCYPSQGNTTASVAPTSISVPSGNLNLTAPKAAYTESDFKANTNKIACPPVAPTVGEYNNAHYNSNPIAVNLCEIPSMSYNGRKYTGKETVNGHPISNSLAAEAFYNFGKDYKAITGQTVIVSQSFRTYDFQNDVYNCVNGAMSNEAFKQKYSSATGSNYNCRDSFTGPARAGNSKHEAGLAMDLYLKGMFDIENEASYGYDPSSCKTGAFTTAAKTDSGSKWNGHSRWTLKGLELMCEMLPKYGLKFTVSNEPWHIQYVGKY